MSTRKQYQSDPNINIVTGVCAHDCPDSCSWQVAVEQTSGRAIDIWGHAKQPVTAGALCGKVDRYLERTYHRDRLTTPLRRTGPKGSGQFEDVSWEVALAEIAERLQGVIAQHGEEAVLPYSYAGTMGMLQQNGLSDRFFNRIGASRLARGICSQAGFEGVSYTIGSTVAMETESYAHAKLILIWGSNTLTSNLHLWPFIVQARKAGARVIVIDPAKTRTAKAANEWIAIQPGTDAALALSMIHVIIRDNLHDASYVADHTLGFDQLAERVREWTPARAAQITGVPAERIETLAREYATTRPAAIRMNYGMQRHVGGGMASRVIACLPALVGAWTEYGGGFQLSASGTFRHFDYGHLYRTDLLAGRTPRTINMNRLGDALSLDRELLARSHAVPRPVDQLPTPAEAGPLVKALIIYNCNPAAVSPDQAAVLAGLQREDLFTVVLEHFQTDTADYADYLLPATTQLEHWDLQRPYGHLFLGLNQPAIAPIGESLPNSEIFRRLARAMGYDDPCFHEEDETILRTLIEKQTHPDFETITWDRLMDEGFARLNVADPYLPFAHGNFPTPSGKCEFYSERMRADGYDPLPTYTPPNYIEMPEREADSDWLICISPPAHSFLNTTFANVDRFLTRESKPIVQIHPDDAAARQVATGDSVRLSNELGSVLLTAQVTDSIVAGTLLAPGIWWNKFSPDGRNINQITPQLETDMGSGATFYDTLVRVEVVAQSEPLHQKNNEEIRTDEPVAAD